MNPPIKTEVLYLCNQQKCKNCDVRDGVVEKTGWNCRHTTDISYAKNYTTQPPRKTLEKHFEHMYINKPIPTESWMEKEENDVKSGKDSEV